MSTSDRDAKKRAEFSLNYGTAPQFVPLFVVTRAHVDLYAAHKFPQRLREHMKHPPVADIDRIINERAYGTRWYDVDCRNLVALLQLVRKNQAYARAHPTTRADDPKTLRGYLIQLYASESSRNSEYRSEKGRLKWCGRFLRRMYKGQR